jgi:hypothetical protein
MLPSGYIFFSLHYRACINRPIAQSPNCPGSQLFTEFQEETLKSSLAEASLEVSRLPQSDRNLVELQAEYERLQNELKTKEFVTYFHTSCLVTYLLPFLP